MSLPVLCQFMVIAGVAAYVQTLTGFAFGLVMMSAIGLLGLTSLAEAAVIVGSLSVVNSVHILARGWQYIAWREFWIVIGPTLAATVAGFGLLQYFAATNLAVLQLALGVVIIVAGSQLLLKPDPSPERSSVGRFIAAGAAGGLLGGMFSTAGPPLVYLFYRQPMPLAAIRVTLVLVFTLSLVLRTMIVVGTGSFPYLAVAWNLLVIPAILAATEVAHRWPPALSPRTLRSLVFILLLTSGLSLTAQALF